MNSVTSWKQWTGAELIAAERQRQIHEEKWDVIHDDEHSFGELASAAICYAMPQNQFSAEFLHKHWPFSYEWWKPKDRIRDLVRAGALIAAEIDRLQRRTDESSM